MSHTPGPWKARVLEDGRGGVWHEASTAAVFVTNAIEEADARLIAAAPDLLAFVERVVAYVDALVEGGAATTAELVMRDGKDGARAVVAKARGDS